MKYFLKINFRFVWKLFARILIEHAKSLLIYSLLICELEPKLFQVLVEIDCSALFWDPIETGYTAGVHFYLNWSHFYMIKNNEFDILILGNRVNWWRINRHTYKLTLKPLLFDCATLALVYFDYYANRNFSLKVTHWNQIILVSSNDKNLIFLRISSDFDKNYATSWNDWHKK